MLPAILSLINVFCETIVWSQCQLCYLGLHMDGPLLQRGYNLSVKQKISWACLICYLHLLTEL